jgi:RND family efflux transporter MFP subunit
MKVGQIGTVILAGVFLAACGGSKPAPAAGAAAGGGAMQGMPVQVDAAQPVPVAQTSTYVAAVISLNSTVVTPLVSGILRSIAVKSGDHVTVGEPLATIDNSIQAATVANLRSTRAATASTLSFDQQQLQRAQTLYQEKIGTQQDFQQAQSAYNAAKAQVDSLDAQIHQAEVTLSYYTITAPRTGIAGDVPVRVGDSVTLSTTITTIDSGSGLQVYTQVPLEDESRLKLGLPITIQDANGKTLAHTTISFISPQVDMSTQSILVKGNITSSTQPLRNQQFVKAEITWGTKPQILVPVLSVVSQGGASFVYIAAPRGQGYYAHQVQVQLGPIQGNDYPVQSGLNPGDKLIVSTTQTLAEGAPVIPMPAGGAAPGRGAAGRG